jgi:dihydrofolate reductase
VIRAMMSMSLDGYITGPNAGVDNGLGDGGEVLHAWIRRSQSWRQWAGGEGGEPGPDSDLLDAAFKGIGAGVMGHGMFGGPEGRWGDNPPFGGSVFVLTSTPRPQLVKGDTTFVFVDSYYEAMSRARDAAGALDVAVSGGGRTICQAIAAQDLDELVLSVVPVLLGAGTPMFASGSATGTLQRTEVLASPTGVTHLRYRLER